jgi:hypothetical protein
VDALRLELIRLLNTNQGRGGATRDFSWAV